MINDLFGEVAKVTDTSLTMEQRRQNLETSARGILQLSETLEVLAKSGNKSAMNTAAQKIAASLEQLVQNYSYVHWNNFLRLQLPEMLMQLVLIHKGFYLKTRKLFRKL